MRSRENPLNILRFPLLALENCFQNMSIVELIKFSLCSLKAKECVKLIRRHYLKYCDISFQFSHRRIDIVFLSKSDPEPKLRIDCTPYYAKIISAEKLLFGREAMLFQRFEKDKFLGVRCENEFYGALEIGQHLLEIFQYSAKNLYCSSLYDLETVLHWIKNHNSVEELILDSPLNVEDIIFAENYLKGYKLTIKAYGAKHHLIGDDELFIDNCSWSIIERIWEIKYASIRVSFNERLWLNRTLRKWISFGPDYSHFFQLIGEIGDDFDLVSELDNVPHILKDEKWVHPTIGEVTIKFQIEQKDKSQKAIIFESVLNNKRVVVMYVL